MGTLQAALDWASRGFRVFPLRENSKEPLSKGWVELATSDVNTVRQMWTDPVLGMERNYNIGTLCSDMIVVDIDVKKGKDGYNEYVNMGGNFETLVVQTPSGGWHCYFQGPDSSNCKASDGVDIRSHNGFVVAPGSSIEGVPYVTVRDDAMRYIPDSVNQRVTPLHNINKGVVADFEVDSAGAIAGALNFLQTAPPAIEGMNGDDVTFKTAARVVREFGVSIGNAYEMMRDHWNPRCTPPWPLDELLSKIENAAEYGTAGAGRLTPEATFGDIGKLIAPPPNPFSNKGISWGNAETRGRIPKRDWVVDRFLMRKNITLLMAAGSAGKSSIALTLAAHMTLGLDFAGHKAKGKMRTIVYNGEDDNLEQSRRLEALCMSHELDYDKVKQDLMLVSPRECRLTLVTNEMRKPTRNDALVNMLIEKASPVDVGLIVVDPLVKIHSCEESDNVQMDFVMETLAHIAYEANVAVLVLHHTAKGGVGRNDRMGNMDIGRGASAIVNAARVAFTLLSPSDDDAETYGLTEEDRRRWVRLDDAKMNMSLTNTQATWFKKIGERITSGDIVGSLKYEQLNKTSVSIHDRLASILLRAIRSGDSATMSVKQATAILKTEEPLWAKKTDTEIRQKLEGMFHAGYETPDGTLKVLREVGKDNKENLILIII